MNPPICYRDLGRHGRLGNALFQLASTAGIAARMGTVPRFNADWMHRDYFMVPDELFTNDFDGCVDAADTEAVAHMDPRARPYLQDFHLFSGMLDEIRAWFRPSIWSHAQLAEIPEFDALPRPLLSVHVRRGDKVPGQDPGTPDNHRYFTIPSLSYYRNAIGMLEDRAASIAVFGDEPAWNRENIPGDYYREGVARPKEQDPDYLTAPVLDHIDLFLQAQCDLHVISGSTFGIWGALLAEDPHAIYPFPVFGPRLRYINEALQYPSGWRRLSADRGAPLC